MLEKQTIAVVGGGMSGIAACLELAKTGKFEITLLEKEDQLGGLSTWFQWQDVIWDKFYHVMLSTDHVTLDLVSELDLQHKLFWKETKTGFYGKGQLVSMSTAMDFLRFPFMSLWQKFRMGLGIIYSSRLSNPSKLDKLFAREWLTRVFGRRVYENIWEPLLRSKLGEAREQTSALFIWATIHRLYGARQGQSKKEKMGHVQGGYHSILTAAAKKLTEAGITIRTGEPVQEISSSSPYSVVTAKGNYQFDQVLLTIDCPSILNILRPAPDSYWNNLAAINYLSVYCVVLIISRKLSPYYVINLLDKDLPFTGVIEATNVVSPEETGGKHIVFLPKYAPSDDPIHTLSDDEIIADFTQHLQRMFPDLHNDQILHQTLHKARYVQPVQTLDYQHNLPRFQTPMPGLHIVNTAMIINSTLNNNNSLSLAQQCVQAICSADTSQ